MDCGAREDRVRAYLLMRPWIAGPATTACGPSAERAAAGYYGCYGYEYHVYTV